MIYNIDMGKRIISRRAGEPDFLETGKYPSMKVVSNSLQHFTEQLVKNESKRENLTGLVSNKILIRNVAINSVQALHFRLEFYSKDSFTDSDLDVDTFVGAVELNIPEYGKLA